MRAPEGIFVEGFLEGMLPEGEEGRGDGVVGLGVGVVVQGGGKFAGDEDEADRGFGDEGMAYDACYRGVSGCNGSWNGERTGTTASQTPIFLFHDEALQPGEGPSCFSSEDEFEIEDVAVAQEGFGDVGGMTVDF